MTIQKVIDLIEWTIEGKIAVKNVANEFTQHILQLSINELNLILSDLKKEKNTITHQQFISCAKALSERSAEMCNINPADNWYVYSEDYKDDVKTVISILNIEIEEND